MQRSAELTVNTVVALGGGQLGRMLSLAGSAMGVRVRCYDNEPDAPAGQVGELVVGAFDDEAALEKLARGAAVATCEFENVPLAAAEFLGARLPFRPSAEALAAAQERLAEKSLLRELGIPTAHFAAIDQGQELESALELTGLPAVIKTRRMGYDGKGQRGVRTVEEARRACADLSGPHGLIAEEFIAFERELSLVGVRAANGATAFYPLVENTHEGGILRLTIAPAPNLTRELQERAESYARAVMEQLGYVGVLTIEFFERDGALVANEMACRVHNSGHWTIEGAACSQFENHLRAILGWPLGDTSPLGECAMVNLIGCEAPHARVLGVRGARLHWYGKTTRPGRKVGHVTVVAASAGERDDLVARLGRELDGA